MWMTKRATKLLVRLALVVVLGVLGYWVGYSGKLGQPPAESSALPPGYYPVITVSDGDTFTVKISGKTETVRLIGIDTPETKDPRVSVQCFGPQASAKTHALLEHHAVRLESDSISDNRDKYHRLLRYVYLQDGTFLNQYLVTEGYAFAYTLFPNSRLEQTKQWEIQAKQSRRGLWAACRVDESKAKKQTTGPL